MTQFIEVVVGSSEPYMTLLINISSIEQIKKSEGNTCFAWSKHDDNNWLIRHSYEEVKSAIEHMVFNSIPVSSLVKS